MDHDGFLIYIDPSFVGSCHDMRCFRNSDLGQNCQKYFKIDLNAPYPIQYLLGVPGYFGVDHCSLRRLDRREIEGCNNPVNKAFNKNTTMAILYQWNGE